MIGAMAHPLNRAVIDPELRIVTGGLRHSCSRGLGSVCNSASRSRLASIYSGQTGFDIYTRAISDAYQDCMERACLPVRAFTRSMPCTRFLDPAFPAHSLLSHDLIEGSYCAGWIDHGR